MIHPYRRNLLTEKAEPEVLPSLYVDVMNTNRHRHGVPELRLIRGGKLERERRWQRRWKLAARLLLLLLFSAAVTTAMVAYVKLVVR